MADKTLIQGLDYIVQALDYVIQALHYIIQRLNQRNAKTSTSLFLSIDKF